MAVELYINNQICDIEDFDFQVSYSIAKLGEIEKRSGLVSTDIKLPDTVRNRYIFNNIHDLNNTNTSPYNRYDAKLFVDGVDQLVRSAILESVSEGYTLRLYGLNSEFYLNAKDTKLSDIDLSDSDHFRDMQGIIDSRLRTDYIYPLIDYHADSPNTYIDNTHRAIDVRGMYPALFYDYLLSKCSQHFGYTFVEDEVPPHPLLFPYCGNSFVRNFDVERYKGLFTKTSDEVIPYNMALTGWDWDAVSSNRIYWEIGRTVNATQHDIQDKVKLGGHLHLETSWAGAAFTVKINIATGNILFPEFSQTITIPNGNGSFDFYFSNIENNINESLYLYFTNYSAANNFTVKKETYLNISDVEITQAGDVYYGAISGMYGDYVTMGSIFGDITVADIFSNYCKMFNKIISVNETTKEIRLITLKNIKENINNLFDWSDKLDLSEQPEIKFLVEDYYQINEFNYKDDNENVPLGTNSILTIPSNILEERGEVIGLDYSATNVVSRLKDLSINQIGVMEGGVIVNEKNYRVLYLELIDGSNLPGSPSHVQYNDGSNVNVLTHLPFTWFCTPLKNENLGFGGSKFIVSVNGLANDYYFDFFESLQLYKSVSCLVRLNSVDIANLDFASPVYIKYFNCFFYVNEIKYSPISGSSSQVTLIKI